MQKFILLFLIESILIAASKIPITNPMDIYHVLIYIRINFYIYQNST